MAGGQGLARHGEAVDALGGGVPAHQQRPRLDGEQGAEVAHVHLAVIPLLGFEDPLGCGLHQPLQAGIQAVPGGLPRAMTGLSWAPGAASPAAWMAAASSRSLTPCLTVLAARASCNRARVRADHPSPR